LGLGGERDFMNKEIGVSINCLAFNHEKYIRKTLEGFVMQKTSFPFEVLVHDDASNDNTAGIIREFEEKYPDIIRPIYQKENQYSKRVSIQMLYVLPRVRGKYLAFCEGDDYWTDESKLQKQYDLLESIPGCSMCVHKVRGINEQGELLDRFWPSIKLDTKLYDTQSFLAIRKNYPFQTSSYFVRANIWKEYIVNRPEFSKDVGVGDEPLLLYFAAHGGIFYMDDDMSCYRVMSKGSWSSRNKTPNKVLQQRKRQLRMMQLFDEYTNHQYNCFLKDYEFSVLLHEGRFKDALSKKYCAQFDQLTIKKKLYVHLCRLLPFIDKIRHKSKL